MREEVVRSSLGKGTKVVLTTIIALLLLTSSALKLWEHATTPSTRTDFLNSSWLILTTCYLEIGLAFWTLSGVKRRVAIASATFFFAVVACVAAYKWCAGETSCGCFGRLTVPPWATTLLDLSLLTGLLWTLARESKNTHRAKKPRWIAIGTVWLGVIAASVSVPAAAIAHPMAVSQEGVTDAGGVIILEPEKWIGRMLPIVGSISCQTDFMHGDWQVVLFHNDCSECQRVIPLIDAEARSTGRHCVLIEMPPQASSVDSIVPHDTVCKMGTLDATKEWFATTPVLVELHDGIVRSQKTGESVRP